MEKKFLPSDMFERFFSPFSPQMVEYRGVLYPTAEHAYHCQRYSDPKILKEMKNARSPKKAWEISQRNKDKQLPDFESRKVEVMEEIFRAKLEQHEEVKRELIESKQQVIVKNYPDPFWGVGEDGTGRNEMGKIWMRLRKELEMI